MLSNGLILDGPGEALDIREALNLFLRNDATLSSITGGRIRPGAFSEQDPLPAITYEITTNKSLMTLDGPAPVDQPTAEIYCFSRKESDCVAMKRRIDTILNGFRGDLNGINVMFAIQDEEEDVHVFALDGTNRTLYGCSVTYVMQHRTP